MMCVNFNIAAYSFIIKNRVCLPRFLKFLLGFSCEGVAVGAGWQWIVAYINIGCYYIVGLPAGILLGFTFGFGVTVMFQRPFILEWLWLHRLCMWKLLDGLWHGIIILIVGFVMSISHNYSANYAWLPKKQMKHALECWSIRISHLFPSDVGLCFCAFRVFGRVWLEAFVYKP